MVWSLAERDVNVAKAEQEDGLIQGQPSVAVMRDLAECWPEGKPFVPSQDLCDLLVAYVPDRWGAYAPDQGGKPLSPKRLGRLLAGPYGIGSERPDQVRGYTLGKFLPVWSSLGIPAPTLEAAEVAVSGGLATSSIDVDEDGWPIFDDGPQAEPTLTW
jgi:hypothetical protein